MIPETKAFYVQDNYQLAKSDIANLKPRLLYISITNCLKQSQTT